MDSEQFKNALAERFDNLQRAVMSDTGEWVVKGFIDTYKNIYTISLDTKVVSKIVELLLFPVISQFASDYGYRMVLSKYQNHYPDITFVGSDESAIALDLKSTYRTNSTRANGFTLGAFTGYFRDRESTKNVTLPYGSYDAHLVLGMIYSRNSEAADERLVYSLDQLQDIVSVVGDFEFVLQEKWRIASARPGSGNTKNIGSVTSITTLLNGTGPFARYGEKVFDDYWSNYMTSDMAKLIDSTVPYRTLDEYRRWRDGAPHPR